MAEISDEVYESFSSSLIKDFQFSKLLKDNIKFVYLYLDKADSIEDNDEKEILYRELGSVVFSCLEALCKTVIDMIRKQCENHKCNNIGCCPYIAGLNSPHLIENAKTLDVISHLVQTRLFYLSPEQEHEIHLLRDQRNFIHLSKDIFAVNSYELTAKISLLRCMKLR